MANTKINEGNKKDVMHVFFLFFFLFIDLMARFIADSIEGSIIALFAAAYFCDKLGEGR